MATEMVDVVELYFKILMFTVDRVLEQTRLYLTWAKVEGAGGNKK